MAGTVTLDDDLLRSIDGFIDRGQFASRADVIRSAMEMMRDFWVDDLDAALDKGLADIKAGRTKPADEVFTRLQERYAKMLDERAD